LHFFHFASHCFGIAGIGIIIAAIFNNFSHINQGATYISSFAPLKWSGFRDSVG
jgi:hypothetical protein